MKSISRLLLIFALVLSGMIGTAYAGVYDDCKGKPGSLGLCMLDETFKAFSSESGRYENIGNAFGLFLVGTLFALMFFLGTRNFFEGNRRMALVTALILGVLSTFAFNRLAQAEFGASPALVVGIFFFVILTFAASLAMIYYGSKWIGGQREDGVQFTNIFKLFMILLIVFAALSAMTFVLKESLAILEKTDDPTSDPADDPPETAEESTLGQFGKVLWTIVKVLGYLAIICLILMLLVGVVLFVLLILGIIGLTGGAIYAGTKWARVRSQKNNPAREIRNDLRDMDQLVSRVENRVQNMNDYLRRDGRR